MQAFNMTGADKKVRDSEYQRQDANVNVKLNIFPNLYRAKGRVKDALVA